jgi:fatty-acyl-CoA synthase
MRQTTLSTSHWPADASEPVRGTTVPDILRGAAARAPGAVALIEGVADRGARRRWTFEQLLDEFPLTASGKVQKYLLRERLLNGQGSGRTPTSTD